MAIGKSDTTTIPIVFLAADDPVKFGLVTSLSRPGGNATGLNLLTSELTTKRLELIRDPRGLVVVPHAFYPIGSAMGTRLDSHAAWVDAVEINAMSRVP